MGKRSNKKTDSKSGGDASSQATTIALTSPKVEVIPDTKHVRILVKGYANFVPTYSASALTVHVSHAGHDLGTSSKTPVIDEDYISTQNEFVVMCDINSSAELDQLISYPVFFNIYECVGEVNKDISKSVKPKTQLDDLFLMSVESTAALSEAYTGKPVTPNPPTKLESGDGVTLKKSKQSVKKSKSNISKDNPSEGDFTTGPILLGKAALDLLPLFQGNKEFTETLIVHQPKKTYDDEMVPANVMPRLIVQISIDEDTWLPEDPNFNIFSLTVESIYNPPLIMSQDLRYMVSTLLPLIFGDWEHVVIDGGKITSTFEMEKPKWWPGIAEEDSLCGSTSYKIDDTSNTIINNIGADLGVLNLEKPRVEWNIIKRNYMTSNAVRQFIKKIKQYRHLPFELYVTSAKKPSMASSAAELPTSKDIKNKSKSEGSTKSGKNKKGSDKGAAKKEIENFIHAMSIVDVSTLLYPGSSKCRIACVLNTYNNSEILKSTGQEKSHFVMSSIPIPEKDSKAKGSRSKSKSSKGTSKGKGSSKGTSKDKRSKKGTPKDLPKNDLAVYLPPPPLPPPQPSVPIYNETGERTFILLEFEFLKPLHPKRPFEDLTDQLSSLLPPIPSMTKIVLTSRVTNFYFKDVITQLATDLAHQHQNYLNERNHCNCHVDNINDSQAAFRTYLQRNGAYHTYLTSITKAASVIVNDKFPSINEFRHNSKEYQNFIAEVYTYLISEMNVILNGLSTCGTERSPTSPLMALDSYLLYAREATAIGAIILADRYYLERIARDFENADYWFDYAVFQLEIGDKEKGLECVKLCLVYNKEHHYGLLLCGILLAEKKLEEEAETCFLAAVLHKRNWVEGWATMHLFYSELGNKEGSELSLQMANKYLNSETHDADYFNSIDDLAWTKSVCPNTVFFRTAALLIQMRVFLYAEKALTHELIKNPGLYHYYLAVIQYYKQNYEHALIHLKEAEQLYGSDYGVASLTGHCYLALRKLENAKNLYLRVLASYNRPDDMHLLYIYLAVVEERLGNPHAARKLLLMACKYSPTPYTWLTAGVLYYGQNDFLSAEECLIQANLCDNRLPEIWGYLAMVNLELERNTEAEMCYRQAKRNRMRDEELEKKICNAMKAVPSENK